jgi:molybdenum cofactor biosynthesis enzyme MoaA
MTAAMPLTRPVDRTFAPEECPYETVLFDITHRCNMACNNCYIPNRTIPDLDAAFITDVLRRLPAGRYVRLIGAEPTMRQDLPLLIEEVRRNGHHPILVTNGLRLADRAYLRTLKNAGLQIIYLSFNGGFDDDLYESIDGMPCAEKKRMAFDNLTHEHVYTSIGMIVVRGANEGELKNVVEAVRQRRNVRELHLRSIGPMGRYMESAPYKLDDMLRMFSDAAGIDADAVDRRERTDTSHDFRHGRMRVQLTVWPDLGSTTRGRLTPDGMIAPAMEHMMANEGGY